MTCPCLQKSDLILKRKRFLVEFLVKKRQRFQLFDFVIFGLATSISTRGFEVSPSTMGTKIKGVFKGFKFISHIFVMKEREMEIGYPTDVKHLAHIGWDGSSGNAPSWMNEFKIAPDFASTSIGNSGSALSTWSSQDFGEAMGRRPTVDTLNDLPPVDLPSIPKKQRRKKSKSTCSPKSSSRAAKAKANTETMFSKLGIDLEKNIGVHVHGKGRNPVKGYVPVGLSGILGFYWVSLLGLGILGESNVSWALLLRYTRLEWFSIGIRITRSFTLSFKKARKNNPVSSFTISFAFVCYKLAGFNTHFVVVLKDNLVSLEGDMFQSNMFENLHHHLVDMSHKTTENNLDMHRDDDHDSKPGTDIMEGNDQDPNQHPTKKKRYHRHTQHQIQEMESFFKECPHLDDKQRKELGRRLSLEPLQIKFWFQNKQTQMKAQHERYDNTQLRNENEKLRAENLRFMEALTNATCPNCGGPAAIGEMSYDEQHLRIENAHLREEIDRIFGIAAKYVGKPTLTYPDVSSISHGPSRSLDLPMTNFNPQQGMAGEMFGASDLLPSKLAETEKPIIIKLAVAAMEELIKMAQNQWCGIVSRAMTLEVLSTGVAGNYNGALQVVRGSIFEVLRRPSGCLIQELPNGYSKVTWVEHVEIDDGAVHDIYKVLVNSGLAFDAKRWVATLERQCERLASAMASNIPEGDVGSKYISILAERMVLSFCSGVGASTAHTWTTLSGSGPDDVRVMTRKSMDDPGRPAGIVLSAATSFWLPIPPKQVFEFLHDDNSRSEWDILSNCGLIQEMAHIANGSDPGNCVSLLRVNSANSSQSNMLILQESSSDSAGSYVIYAPVDIASKNVVLNGGDPDYVALLPSGFAILPDGPGQYEGGVHEVGTGGSLITVAFQILVDSVPTAKISLGSGTTCRLWKRSRQKMISLYHLKRMEEVKNAPWTNLGHLRMMDQSDATSGNHFYCSRFIGSGIDFAYLEDYRVKLEPVK
ncbi:hypothetical protein L1987_28396 [Smallanthus sonchifolius]|uniref:Uncharacterized protein n=1 Tax=Smallanthus sonchifolius TaxID=185202 RepID=A0ACB9HWZ7_9ASTR|nr:hypothetical protein L1987_28396 [Smallanthus sonchifolius]